MTNFPRIFVTPEFLASSSYASVFQHGDKNTIGHKNVSLWIYYSDLQFEFRVYPLNGDLL